MFIFDMRFFKALITNTRSVFGIVLEYGVNGQKSPVCTVEKMAQLSPPMWSYLFPVLLLWYDKYCTINQYFRRRMADS